jgi:hypothetical protein
MQGATVTGFHNIFACLVHESPECIVDLVRNLRYLDPSSTILLYNGGKNPDLLSGGFPFERYGAVIHPSPRPLEWGTLHDFALDCARFAFDRGPFDTMTIVDSDQLATRPGYSEALATFLSKRPRVGMIASEAGPQPIDSLVDPVVVAFEEFDLWRPFLRKFPEGESRFVHWTFWPGTVFTRAALRDLVRLFDEDADLRQTLAQSRIWATEEILLPTLTALLGHEMVATPFRHDFVQFRVWFDGKQVDSALSLEDVFWIHPIPRLYSDGRRRYIRERLDHYKLPPTSRTPTAAINPPRLGSIEPTPSPRARILAAIDGVDGWLSVEEADLLIRIAEHAIAEHEPSAAFVEVGAYCGRATIVLGSVAKALRPEVAVYSVDPHDGVLGALDQGLLHETPSLERFRSNIERAGLTATVREVVARSSDITWDQPISLLLIDGLHDYVNLALDFNRFEPCLADGGYVAFHDFGDYFPGVKAFVAELLASGSYERVDLAGSLVVLRSHRGAPTSLGRFPSRAAETSRESRVFCDLHEIDLHPDLRVFNPSIAKSHAGIVISYNRATTGWNAYQIGLAEFDGDFRQRRDMTLDFSNAGGTLPSVEDMRLFVHQGILHGVYYEGRLSDENGGLNLVTFDENLALTSLERLEIPGLRPRHFEKNWQFFSHQGELFGVYTICPHQVFRKVAGGIEPIALVEWNSPWSWGQMRGGTPPIAFEGEYLSFFHSHIHQHAWHDRVYHAGAYTFSATPPFPVTRITSEPLMTPPTDDRYAGYPSVVFPSGSIWHEGKIIVTYGYHDHRARAAIYHPAALSRRLIKVASCP